MTATDELRRLLDERGVEWDGEAYEGCTFWNDETNLAVASEGIDGKLWVSQSLTPAQAIAATLGSGTCHDIGYRMDSTRFKCSQCGWDGWVRHAKDGRDYKPLWCPLCGAKVVGE